MRDIDRTGRNVVRKKRQRGLGWRRRKRGRERIARGTHRKKAEKEEAKKRAAEEEAERVARAQVQTSGTERRAKASEDRPTLVPRPGLPPLSPPEEEEGGRSGRSKGKGRGRGDSGSKRGRGRGGRE